MAFKVNGTDIDSLFEPIGVTSKIPNVGYKVAGTDISNLYADAALGTAYGTTNYNKIGTDIGNLFAALGSVPIDYFLYVWGNNSPVINIDAIVPILWGNSISAGSNFSAGINNEGTLWTFGSNSDGQLGDGLREDFMFRNNRSVPSQLNSSVFNSVSLGRLSAFAIRNDGALFGWGANSFNELGIGDTFARSNPVQIGTSSWTQISAGSTVLSHQLAIRNDGILFAWGNNANGQLGLGDTIDRSLPTQVGSDSWVQINTAGYASFAIKDDQTLYSWGSGSLGNGDTISRSLPTQVGTSSWTSLSSGKGSSFQRAAIRIDGGLFMWGDNSYGQLGFGDTISRSLPTQLGIGNWNAVSTTGASFTAAISAGGGLFTWGANNHGQLGQGDRINRSSPVQVGLLGWSRIATTNEFILGKLGSNQLYAWGRNYKGQLGTNDTINRSSPVQIGGQLLNPASPVTLGSNTSWFTVSANKSDGSNNPYIIALTSDRLLYTWGDNTYGQMGDNSVNYSSSPTQIGSSSWTQVSAGKGFALAIRTDGALFSWGRNTNGELGSNDAITTTYSWTQISNGDGTTAAIRNDGLLFTWGRNNDGSLGSGDLISRSSPTQIGTDSWSSVSVGKSFRAFVGAIRNDGALFTWGSNTNGELGLGDTINRSSPTQVGTSSWTSVSAGRFNISAIRSDGQLFTWGLDFLGGLGLGNDLSWISISAGSTHSAAVRSDNSLFTWGENNFGQLGTGDRVRRSTPTQIGLDEWNSVTVGKDTGNSNTFGIKTDGKLYAWGVNYSGQLGLNDTINRSSPTQVGIDNWSSVSSDGSATFAIKDNNTLFSWGANNFGQLGLNDNVSRSNPTQIGIDSWTQISADGQRAIAIRDDGLIFNWGRNNNGQLGLEDLINRSNPAQVGTDSWTSVSAGRFHTGAIRNDGALFMWGAGSSGRLGVGDTLDRSSPTQVGTSSWTSVSAGFTHTTAIYSDNSLYTWGVGNVGQLGNNSTSIARSNPVQVDSSSWTNISTGWYHTLGVVGTTNLFAWGLGTRGELGINSTISRSTPVGVNATIRKFSPTQIGTSSWTMVSSFSHNAAIRSDGYLFTWGVNLDGQLGLGDRINRSSPTQVGISSWSLTSAGGNHTMAIKTDGTLFTWGRNAYGQLGISTGIGLPSRSSPIQIGFDNWTKVSAGLNHSMAIRQDGGLFTWGRNDFGQLGLNNRVNRSSPVQVGTSSWSIISAGYSVSGAITNNNILFTWGNSFYGQLGTILTIPNISGLNRSSPVQVGNNLINVSSPVQIGTSSWKFISSGLSHVMAISNENKLFTWGANSSGQLGLGTSVSSDVANRSSPTQVGMSSWNAIASGGSHSVAIMSDQKLFAWGADTYGQKGTSRSGADWSPVQVGADNWNKVGAGIIHTGAIRSDGYLFMWGAGSSGRLGVGEGATSTINRSSPVQIGSSSWTIVSLGLDHSAAIRTDGALFTWGAGTNGKLGLGNDQTVNRSSPVQVGSSSWTGIGAGPGFTVGFTNI
jgi:alpha-tubulin suppressor-like RCC1 family protein